MNEAWLAHHGILGQKWGERRFQNEDGSLTAAGRRRYEVGEKMDVSKGNGDSSITRKVKRDYNSLSDQEFMNKYRVSREEYRKRVNKYGDPYMNSPMAKLGKKLAAKKGKDPEKVAKQETQGSVAKKGSQAAQEWEERTKKALEKAKNKKISQVDKKQMSDGKKKAALIIGTLGAATVSAAVAYSLTKSAEKKQASYKISSDQFKKAIQQPFAFDSGNLNSDLLSGVAKGMDEWRKRM